MDANGRGTSCTGFMIKPKFVLTANHCLQSNSLSFDGFPGRLIKNDEYLDLALVNVSEELKPSLTLRDEEVVEGEGLTGIGYGYGWEIPLVIAEKVVIPNYAVDPGSPTGIIVQGGYIGGMSGGPVIDKDGQVVGIIQRAVNSIGYGVGTQMIKAFLLDAKLNLK